MNSERTLIKGRLSDINQQLEELELQADNLVLTIRQKIDPLLDFNEMDIRRAHRAMNDLAALDAEAKAKRELKAKLEDRLHG